MFSMARNYDPVTKTSHAILENLSEQQKMFPALTRFTYLFIKNFFYHVQASAAFKPRASPQSPFQTHWFIKAGQHTMQSKDHSWSVYCVCKHLRRHPVNTPHGLWVTQAPSHPQTPPLPLLDAGNSSTCSSNILIPPWDGNPRSIQIMSWGRRENKGPFRQPWKITRKKLVKRCMAHA